MKQRMFAMVAAMTLAVGLVGIAGATAQSSTDDPTQVEAGRVVFESNCAGCHGSDGTGSNSGRPLTDVATQEPDRLVHIASVTDGKGNMPAFGADLTGDEIDAAVSYVRLTFVTQAEPELAVTGIGSGGLAIGGAVLLMAGAALVLTSRREGTI